MFILRMLYVSVYDLYEDLFNVSDNLKVVFSIISATFVFVLHFKIYFYILQDKKVLTHWLYGDRHDYSQKANNHIPDLNRHNLKYI